MTKQDRGRRADAWRRKERPWRAWYKLPLWQARRLDQLSREPLCRRCEQRGLVVAATVANHVIPHRGDWTLFSTGDLESVCKDCHDGLVQAEERRGHVVGCSADGRPLDPTHPWNVPRSAGVGGSKV